MPQPGLEEIAVPRSHANRMLFWRTLSYLRPFKFLFAFTLSKLTQG